MWTILHSMVFSIIVIIIFHYLWNYIKDTYSTKRTKDLVGFQTEKYKSIVKEIIDNRQSSPQPSIETSDFLNQKEKQNMDDDLSTFMQQQLYTGGQSDNIPLQITL